jgi:HK97 family phage prohead protease
VLGRNKSGTLRLSVDGIGLRYEIDPPDTQAARDLIESLRRGDVSGSSFAFLPT